MNKKITISIVIILLIGAGAFFYLNGSSQESNLPEVGTEVGKRAPGFTLEDLNGNQVSLSDYQGQKIFLNFWASWCPPCRAEMPDMQKLHEEEYEDFVILAVNIGETKATAVSFMMQNNINFKVLLDSDKEIAREYLVRGIPTSYFIDENGVIFNKTSGTISYERMLELAELN